MVGLRAAAVLGLLGLGACAEMGIEPLPPMSTTVTPVELEFATISGGYARAFEQAFSEAPFENGAMAVIAPDEAGEIATYRLVPCQDGRAVCAGSEGGPAGRLARTPNWLVVSGLHGRTFWLGHGGDGYVERGGRFVPLAWDARRNGTGEGDDPVLETPYPHRGILPQ